MNKRTILIGICLFVFAALTFSSLHGISKVLALIVAKNDPSINGPELAQSIYIMLAIFTFSAISCVVLLTSIIVLAFSEEK